MTFYSTLVFQALQLADIIASEKDRLYEVRYSNCLCNSSESLRPVYTCDFRCDFGAILRTKPAPAYPARVYSRVTLRQNTAKLAEIRKKAVFK